MKFMTDHIANVVNGRLESASGEVSGAATDSRAIVGGELFVPLKAERDGHEFIDQARSAGAAAYFTENAPLHEGAIVVDDAHAALKELARHGRQRLEGNVVGITGSVGKTTTKDMARAVLATEFRAHANIKSFNNDIGLPLNILNAPDDTEVLVTELGTNAPGEIRDLCEIARPTIGVVTVVASGHTEGLKDEAGVAVAKRELIEALPADGLAILNSDDYRVAAMAQASKAPVLRFGSADADIVVEVLDLDAELRPLLKITTPKDVFETRVSARGVHQATNAGAAAAIGFACGVSPEGIALGLQSAEMSPLRMVLETRADGLRVLNDSYNANPASTEAALHSLKALGAKRAIAALGTMAELGDISEIEHGRIAQLASDLGIELVAVNEPKYGLDVHDIEGAYALLANVGPETAVLVKASNSVGLGRLAEMLLADA